MGDLAPGFRFYPTEEELVTFYLPNKLEGKNPVLDRVIPVVDIYKLEPWHLSRLAGELCKDDTEQWFYFVPIQERETRGGRPTRTTLTGYWKATGSPGYVYSGDNRVIGVKKTMVFYKGKAPTGRKTIWKMNEYKAIEECATSTSSTPIPKLRHEFSLCRVYVVSGTSRAFDRRPPELITKERAISQCNGANMTATKPQNIQQTILGRVSETSPERTNSTRKTQVDDDPQHQDIEARDYNVDSSHDHVGLQWSGCFKQQDFYSQLYQKN